MSIAKIMAEMREKNLLQKEASAQPPKVEPAVNASPETDEMAKLAEDIYLSGRIAGIGWFDSLMSKLADEAVPAKGTVPGSAPNVAHDKGSLINKVTKKLQDFHGGQQPGSAPKVPAGSGGTGQVLAETEAPKQDKTPQKG